jgi:hypothetical protein
MAIGRSVQFYGIEKALAAYTNQDVPKWGLFQGAQFLCKYDGPDVAAGAELLSAFLSEIETGYNGNAHTTYTLCVYDGLPNAEKITSKTPYSGSFNFQLVERLQVKNDYGGSQDERIGRILEEKLTAAGIIGGIDEDEDDEPAGPWAAIGKLLDHPEIKNAIAARAIGLMDRFLGGGASAGQIYQPAAPAAAMGAVAITQDEIDRCNQAVQILVTVDPQIGSHLMAIAEVAAKDPVKYKQLISMLSLL